MKAGVDLALEAAEAGPPVEDPWLISLADLVINLLAFMVVLVSMAKVSFETLDALPSAFDSRTAQGPSLRTLSVEVAKLVEKEGLSGAVIAELDAEGLAIQIQDRIAFESGVATLSPEGRALVGKIEVILSKLPHKYRVVVEGHTDDVPISTARFASNWELSAARALEVRRELAARGVDEYRLSIIAYADTRPLDLEGRRHVSTSTSVRPTGSPQEIEELRKRNRRVVIRVH
ncbi:MAG: flagellar motor protein MotB [Deltaproteobacteria bacterium]|nr:flagellar motor protein MotB [Deltaproteobacteria bacterium]